jgi:hypothetical protein
MREAENVEMGVCGNVKMGASLLFLGVLSPCIQASNFAILIFLF